MAQTGYTPILIYSSSTAAAAPTAGNLTNSTLGSELAINITDGKLFYKDNANAIQVIGWKIVPATAGGTGQTSYVQGDLLYATSSTALGRLADVATGNALISGGVGANPAWGKIGLTTHVSGTLPVANGGTGTATAFTAGSVVFAGASGVYSQNNASFFWDNSNTRLGIGTSSPTYNLELAIGTTGQQSLVNFRTANATAANNAGIQIFATPSATATSRQVQAVWDADGANSGGGDYFLITKNGNSGTVDLLQFSNASMRFGANYNGRAAIDMTLFASGGVSIGNTTDPGATNLSVTGSTTSALFNTSSGQIVPASGITTTIFTCPSLNNGCYLVTCNIPGQAPPTYSAVGLVRVGGTTLSFTSLAAATTLTISVSGQNIRVVQNSGGTNAVDWTVTRIS